MERKAGRQGESCGFIKQSERERCRLQISQTDLQAQYRPESEASTECFLPAQCSDMSVLFLQLPVEFCCCSRRSGTRGSLFLRFKFALGRLPGFPTIRVAHGERLQFLAFIMELDRLE